VDKFKECKLELAKARQVITPLIKMAGLHFECKIVLKAPMDPAVMHKDLEKIYSQKDYHTLYFGEIKECYETD
jgi:flavin reductase (DIM6/NTAB) family NADH-FMN oxidoreductase RutF